MWYAILFSDDPKILMNVLNIRTNVMSLMQGVVMLLVAMSVGVMWATLEMDINVVSYKCRINK